MRLFAAVLPPADAVRELAPEVDALRRMAGADALRWTGRPGWHFTLAFYGEVAEDTAEDLTERLTRAARRTGPFPLSLRGGGHFGGRALWVGAAGDTDTMRLLAGRAEAAGRKAGVEMEEHRRYRPHLTVARSRDSADFKPYVAALDTFAGRPWTVGELCLVRSNLPTSGIPGEQPRYETLVSMPLGAGDGTGRAAG
ncbi:MULTISPECIES: RNA 2',3'-cyclic phosphodiesterase [unclassified Streptomyces]|uniref:RNA 2',3'-cyclic phosphodiesterase n=1 Tax=unclassified Streptomyces TaxID=2593676 RepID=UPI00225B7FF9|nr:MULTISPECIES: RNA 2',3'-cyclic phosphodiesterase [unclassified Streptomyces]MCX4990184.1 RNA 2',3'-cyclic phosphodiesterase [Streptomyces sp. NBC_00568]MCX5004585.1 RNA 2',3'-cyclic phosphodiesterase [Streptomyces sp. NBC_00638]